MKTFDEQLRNWERLQENLPGGPGDDGWDDDPPGELEPEPDDDGKYRRLRKRGW